MSWRETIDGLIKADYEKTLKEDYATEWLEGSISTKHQAETIAKLITKYGEALAKAVS